MDVGNLAAGPEVGNTDGTHHLKLQPTRKIFIPPAPYVFLVQCLIKRKYGFTPPSACHYDIFAEILSYL
jgi:hypothetical protein